MAVSVTMLAKNIPGATNAALRNQMIRAAMSVPANIVEGRAQESEKGFARFLNYAFASAGELDYHLLIARDTSAISEKDYLESERAIAEVRKMLRGLIKKLRLPATG